MFLVVGVRQRRHEDLLHRCAHLEDLLGGLLVPTIRRRRRLHFFVLGVALLRLEIQGGLLRGLSCLVRVERGHEFGISFFLGFVAVQVLVVVLLHWLWRWYSFFLGVRRRRAGLHPRRRRRVGHRFGAVRWIGVRAVRRAAAAATTGFVVSALRRAAAARGGCALAAGKLGSRTTGFEERSLHKQRWASSSDVRRAYDELLMPRSDSRKQKTTRRIKLASCKTLASQNAPKK
mmetsp:Transcript_11131/g.32961  ORF Transcript_11131/g.32961 Transcript_11131/m.32961 type:complete len:232 (+) Transcript_11131:926-1621(+)